jgi:PAS domain S-box-containing protein
MRLRDKAENENQRGLGQRTTEARIRLALDAARMGTWERDLINGRDLWSEQQEALFGLAPGSFADTHQSFLDLVHPEDRQSVEESARRAIDGTGRYDSDYRIRRQDGTICWMAGRGEVLRDAGGRATHMVGVTMDITERKLAERSLKESEARTAAVIESALDCIIMMDQAGKVVEWNPAAERTFGHTRTEALGRDMADLIIPPALRDAHRRGLAHYLATGEGPVIGTRLELTGVRRDGSEFPVELAITRISSSEPALFTGYLREISDRKQAQEDLRLAKEQAEAANAAKDQFLAVLSHELRTPLTPVLASVEMIGRKQDLPEEIASALETIRRNVQMEARIIDDLLDLTRISRGKVELRTEWVDAHGSLRHALEVWQQQVEDKGLEVTLHLSARRHHVRADPARLQQVFWNLIGNAVKFTPGGGRITLRSSNASPDRLVIQVCDTGIGIDASLLPRLFNAFEQGERAVTRRYGGLGLGLSISKALVEMHQGTLTVASNGTGSGATFTLTLGIVPAPSVEQPAKPQAGSSSTAPVRILLVEDHEDTLKVMNRLLRYGGHRISMAASVQAATELARTETFDLLISDLGLPDGSGLDLIRLLKAQQPIVRGIALSGFGMDEDVQRSAEAGFDLHLTKPVNLTVLEAAISKLTSKATAV